MTLDREALFSDPKSSVRRFVRRKVRQVLRKPGFTRSDQEDLEQELLLELWERWEGFDAERAELLTFVRSTLDLKIRKIVRDRKAAIRDYRREECSLNDMVPVAEEGTIERRELFAEEARYAHTQTERWSELELKQLALDLEMVLAKLPPDLRELCHLLPDYCVSEIAERQNRSRRQVTQDIARLREHFEAAGLDDYLQGCPSLPKRS